MRLIVAIKILLVPILAALLLGGGNALLLDSQAIVPAPPAAGVEQAARARTLMAWYGRLLTSGRPNVVIIAREQDLNALLAFAARAVPGIAVRARVANEAVVIEASWRLPGLGRYANGRVAVPAFRNGQVTAEFRIGRLNLPPRLVIPATVIVLDRLFGNDLGTRLQGSVDALAFSPPNLARLSVNPPVSLESDLKSGLSRMAGLGPPEAVRPYYEKLLDLETADKGNRHPRPLTVYARELFEMAGRRAAEDRDGGKAVAENRAALLALAIRYGHPSVEHLIGKVRPEGGSLSPDGGSATLAGRDDLARHFLVSAALELAAGSGVAFVAGEFKELLDANRGGSGFSFVDLAADRAGVRFARLADGRAAARQFQLFMKTADETAIFPDISRLPEWLDQKAFEARFGAVDSPAYAAMVATIDDRIARLAAYRAK